MQQRFKPILAGPLAEIFLQFRAGKYFPILTEIGVFQQNRPEADMVRMGGKRKFAAGANHQCLLAKRPQNKSQN